MARRPLVAGNWKMNGLTASIGELRRIVAGAPDVAKTDLMVCPPATLIASFAAAAQGTHVLIGGQDCHALAAGAFTGDISAEMLKDSGASAVIVGHSERRQFHGESDAMGAAKALAARRGGFVAISWIGESEAQREAGRAFDICAGQLAGSVPDGAKAENTAIAYEPIWAIGTGKTATTDDIAQMHAHIRHCLTGRFGQSVASLRILYGGSVKPSNAAEILGIAEGGGALGGGASLKAADFPAIF